MYLGICMKTTFCQLHFRGCSTLHKIGEFYFSHHAQQPQFGQNVILARSKAKIRNWKIINCFITDSLTQLCFVLAFSGFWYIAFHCFKLDVAQ